jgi:hypothetical protein
MSHAIRTFVFLSLIVLGCVTLPAAERAAQTVVITAKPKIEQRGQFSYLVIADTNHSFDIGWGMPPDMQFIPVSLDTNRVYAFTVAQKPFHTITIPELRKVQSSGRTIYDIEVCEVHKTKMDYKEVRISYGLPAPRPDEPSGDIERRLFPHHREYSLGGCVISPDSPKTEKVYFCSDCKKAYEKWKSENKKTK